MMKSLTQTKQLFLLSKQFCLIIIISMLARVQVIAQASAYTFSTTTGIGLTAIGSPTTLIGANVDDNVSAVTNIGFNFTFAGTTYTQFSVSSNGLIALGGTAVTTAYSNATASATTYPVLMPWWDDLYTSTNGVRSQLIGSAPNRQLIVQWEVVSCCTAGTADKIFQVQLVETSNIVRFVYSNGANLSSASVGIASLSTNFNCVNTSTNTNDIVTAQDANNTWPGSGRAYIFTPCTPPANPGFGSNTWNVLGYDGNDVNLGVGAVFKGYYTEPSLSYQSTNRWGTLNSPSNASGWVGCPVGADNHTVVSKRTGVPSNGVYSVSVNQHDDNIQFYVGGANQFESPYCCMVHTDMYTGYMDNTTTLEMRHGEGGGGSNQGLTFTQQNLSATVTKTDLTQSSACGTNTGRITFTNPTGAVASPVFRSNFNAATGVTLSGGASVTTGYLQLTANVGSTYGGAIFANSTNMNGSVFRSEFDYRIFDGSGADGISFNYADMSGAPLNQGEQGFGNGLSVCFVTYTGGGGPYVRIKYAGTVVGADVAVTLRDANFRKCIITVDASNQISVSIAGAAVITNRALPAAFQSANKTNWQYSFAGRTGGATDAHRIDNLVINAYNQYEYSINGTTWNNTGVFTGVAAGTYTPRIRNAAFTAYPVSLANVTLSEPPAPSITSVVTDRTCPSSNNGAINVTLTGGLSNVQYIRIIQNKADYINLAEVQAIELFTGTNVALSKTVTTTSNYDAVNYPPSELVNGITNTANDMWHGNFGTIGQYAEINLAAGYNLDYIRIWNRSDCCWDRANNLVLELRNTAGVLVYSKVINAYNGNNSGAVPFDNNVLNLSWADGGTPLSRTNLAAGNYTLNYLDDAGCTIAHAKTVGTTNTVPSITSVTAAANPICPSATTTITANGVGGSGASLTWYTGTGGTGTNLGATNPLTVGSGTYYARVTGTCTPAVEANITINTHVLDYVNLQFPNAPAAICQGSSVTVYGQVYEPGVTPGAGAQGAGIVAEFGYSTTNTNPNTWTNWFTASFNAAGGGANNDEYQYVFTPPAAGTYYYAYRYRLNACANQYGGYSGTGGGTWNGTTNVSGSITVNAPSVAPTGITGTTTICNGSSTTLTLSGGSAGTGATAQWFSGSCGGTAAGTGNSITVSPSTTTTYHVRYAGTCNTTTCASATITVNALSTTPASITGTTSICNGSSTTLTSTGGTLGGDALDIWYSGSCGTEAFTQEWTTMPYATNETTVNSIAGGVLNVSSTGGDPMIFMDAIGAFNPNTYRYIQLRYRVTAGTGGIAEIFFYNANHAFAVGGESATGALISDGAWHIMNIDMASDPDYTTGGNITGWRFDWANAAGVTMDIDFISLVDRPMLDAAPSITVSPTTSTTYYVGRRGACNTTTCASATVTVNTLSVAPTSITGTTTICNGSSTTLTLSGGSTGTGATAQWFSGSCGGTLVGTGNSITVSPTANTTYFVRYSGTCNTTTCASATVTVNTLSVAPTSITGTTTICNGSSTTLTLSGGSAGTGATAEWFSGSCGGTLVGTGNSITVSPIANTTYFVRYTGTCNTTTCASATVTVNTLSTAPTGITGVTTICNGGSTTLTLSGGSAGTGATVQWFSGSCGGTLVGTGNSITLSPTANTTYFVRYSGTCNTTTCASATVTVNTLSVAPTSITGTTTICNGSSTTLTLSGGSAGTGATAEWFSGSCGGALVGTGNSITVSPTTNTTYFVRYTGTCNTTTCASTTVTVNTLSTAPTGITGVTTICNGGSTTLTLSGGSAGTGATVQWFSGSCGGTLVGTGNSITVSPTANTTYFVRYSGTCNTTTCVSATVTVNTLSTAPTSITGAPIICAGGSSTLTLSGGSAGTGATAEWFAGSCGSTVIGTGNSITVSPTANTTYFVRYTGTCNTTTCASVSVTVGGSTNVILAPSDQLGVASSCDDGGWTYYESTTTPGKYVFAINWNPNGGVLGNSAQKAAAVVSINKSTAPTGTAPTASPVTFVSGGASPGYYMCADPSTSQATFAMQRYWNVNVGGGTLPEAVNVRFFFDPLEYDAVLNAANAWSLANGGYVESPHWFKSVAATDGINNTWNPGSDMSPVRVEHSGWVADLNPLVSGYGFENAVRYVQFNGITSFSGGTLALGVGNGSSLPLDLVSFTGIKEETYNHLSWITAHERNVSHFEIQRSSDAVHFITIGTLAALGNTTEEKEYDFNDNSPLAGNNYYRLRMIDLDGTSTISNIINLNRPTGYVSLTNLYPNPAKAIVNFELYAPSQEEINVKVLDVLGREVFSSNIDLQEGLNTNTLDVSRFTPGLYFLNVTCCGGKVITYKFTCDAD